MRTFLMLLGITFAGCNHPYERIDPSPNSEWFVFVSEELAIAAHERFADELPVFVERFCAPGDVVHVVGGDGLVSFTLKAPSGSDHTAGSLKRDVEEAAGYFLLRTHLEGLDSCRLDLDQVEWQMSQLRETNFRHAVILLGSKRPHRFLDYGCECENRPHSLLKEFFARRFHPEFDVPTKKMLDFQKNYGY
ncbi:hypothetical protein KOR34_23970 [Posidoniimonas corsicana]|uniref:Uncharacterized protein n=1 Tax=Posidoniimonas corsicana TaxID=1938618 RepID=A0A5C5VFS1_9BACT|nr:hypothetical protein [Posidoniimonas corsicana]TWT37446.1 hypothetical protein KOR34_23970 [Posidoniimonas corsicana]